MHPITTGMNPIRNMNHKRKYQLNQSQKYQLQCKQVNVIPPSISRCVWVSLLIALHLHQTLLLIYHICWMIDWFGCNGILSNYSKKSHPIPTTTSVLCLYSVFRLCNGTPGFALDPPLLVEPDGLPIVEVGSLARVIWKRYIFFAMPFIPLHARAHTHTHTHTHIYIYFYLFIYL